MRKWVLILTVAGVVVVAWSGLSSSAGTGPAQIRITTKQVKHLRVDLGKPGRTPGDTEILTYALFNKRITQQSIGHAEFVCTFTIDISRSCRGTYFLPKGKLVVGGSLRFNQIYELAVLGGTNLYDNARGTLTVTRLQKNPVRRDLALFRLVG
jgi:hypothetical protein